MNVTLLEEAKKSLLIQDVYLGDSSIVRFNEFDARFCGFPTIDVQYRQGSKFSQRIELSAQDDPEKKIQLLKVYFETAFRMLPPNLPDEIKDNPEESSKKTLVEVSATFIAEYVISQPVSDEAVDEFCVYNAGYHVWPYWREYAHSVTEKLRIPRIVVPLYQIPTKAALDQPSAIQSK